MVANLDCFRTHRCNSIRIGDVGKTVRLAGWVNRKRDHGGILFIDLRDENGITQVVVNPETPFFDAATATRPESVIVVTGTIVARSPETINSKLGTGEVELVCEQYQLESAAQVLPFQVCEDLAAPEDMRLEYRFLDLRREPLHQRILLRSKLCRLVRRTLEDEGFTELQTPILTSSSPEGARDFLVPSRMHPGQFYALPQAPQQFKQLFMASGFDRYFQIAPCFRDEDARADRSPGEFYQIDIEMAFPTQDEIFAVVERLMNRIFGELSTKKVPEEFVRIPYLEAIESYGTDKPDLRFDMQLVDLCSELANTKARIFASTLKSGGAVKAIRVANISGRPRKFFDDAVAFAQSEGAPGLAWLTLTGGKTKGPLAKFLSAEELAAIYAACGVQDGDAVFFGAGDRKFVNTLLGKVRLYLAKKLDLQDKNQLNFCWIVDFPMYEWDEDAHKWEFSHNPFSMPQGGMKALDEQDPGDILAYQYDLVCNGIELSSGAIRNHSPELMARAFDIVGYGTELLEEKFPALWRAFHYGTPPHGGIAPGLERILMLLTDQENLREVIAFPFNQKAQDLLMGAPGRVSERQLREVHIELTQLDDE